MEPVKSRLHLVHHVDLYSLNELVRIDWVLKFARSLYAGWLSHATRCALCRAKGSICEFCRRVLYPWESQVYALSRSRTHPRPRSDARARRWCSARDAARSTIRAAQPASCVPSARASSVAPRPSDRLLAQCRCVRVYHM
jgi:hypothetical protein